VSGLARIGVVASVLWAIGAGFYVHATQVASAASGARAIYDIAFQQCYERQQRPSDTSPCVSEASLPASPSLPGQI
jgi:CDP-diacylglycerol pyrophosphatase